MVFSIILFDREIVDAGKAHAHEAVLVKIPVLVAIAAEPISTIVMPFIGEAHGNAAVVKCPNLFYQAVVEFAAPFAS
jgi:hypothetical protein